MTAPTVLTGVVGDVDGRAQADPPRFDVLGVGVSAIDMGDALRVIDGWIASSASQYVCVTGVHGIMESRRDPELRRVYNDAGLVTPDGMPLVWLAHREGYRHVDRVYGPDLLLALCDHGRARGLRHFFYGGADGVADLLAGRLTERFPGLAVAGTYCPPFRPLSPEEDDAVVEMLHGAQPDVVWVGLGAPRQERWMAAHKGRVPAVMIGVGAAFDFHSGRKPQAPRWMQRSGLEWAFRLASEPRRLWRRYLVHNTGFVMALLRRWLTRGGRARG